MTLLENSAILWAELGNAPEIIPTYEKGGVDMSYSFNNPCYNCKKNYSEVNGVKNENPCKDAEKINSAIYGIHQSGDGSHQGSGEVLLMCTRVEPINK